MIKIYNRNISIYKPIEITFIQLENEILQVDIQGKGLLNFYEKYTQDLYLEIYTNVQKAISKRKEEIDEYGIFININPLNKIDRNYNLQLIEFDISLYFQNPFENSKVENLKSFISFISNIITKEIILLNRTAN
jgi:hypothetical protein